MTGQTRQIGTRDGAQCLFILFHLGMVALGAWRLDLFSGWPLVSSLVKNYQFFTGADSGYEFFAPGVGTQIRAVFDLTATDGRTQRKTLEQGLAHEADLRISGIVNTFWQEEVSATLQRSLAASWAGQMFGRYPGTSKITVRIQIYELASMKGYRDGSKPYWQDYYVATFKAGPTKRPS